MTIFDEIKTGLQQAIEYEKGSIKARSTTLSITPVEEFSAADIKNIRKATGLTLALFASFMGVSQKTVEAWESGRNQPNGAACRLLALTKSDPQFPLHSGIASI